PARGRPGGAPAMGVRPASRPVPAAGLVPPKPDSPERAWPAEERPAHKWHLEAGAARFRAAQSGPASTVGGPGRLGLGSRFSLASTPADAPPSVPDDAAASTPDDATASAPDDGAAGGPAAPPPPRPPPPPPPPPPRPPPPSPPPQSGTGSALFPSPGQPPFPPAPRPAAEPGAAGTWRHSAGPGPFPPVSKPATGAPATGASGTDIPAAGPGQP